MKPRILFVDDEAKILQGLKRSLRPLRNEWDVDFAVGGAEALSALETQPADVVVSDMRMPGMSGAALLDKVQESFPGTARLVLSGQCEEDNVYRLTRNSHQFFSKPCDAERLTEAIRRILTLRDRVTSQSCRTPAAGAAILPSDPEVEAALRVALAAPEPALPELSGIIAKDPGLAAKLLQLASSAYFGTGSAVASLTQALQRIGVDTLKRLVQDEELPRPLAGNAEAAAIWERARQRARLARHIGRSEELAESAVELAGLAALLLDAGDLLLVTESVADCGAECRAQRAALSGYLLGLWGLPQALVDAVAYQDEPAAAPKPEDRLLAVVHAVRHLAASGGSEAVDDGYLAGLGLDQRLPVWAGVADELRAGAPGDD